MESVELYSTHCPKCNVLESKLKSKNIPYIIIEGDEPIIKAGFTSAPILKVNEKFMEFSEAVSWVNGYVEGK